MGIVTNTENYYFNIMDSNDALVADASTSLDNNGMFNFTTSIKSAKDFYADTKNRQLIHDLLDKEFDKASEKYKANNA